MRRGRTADLLQQGAHRGLAHRRHRLADRGQGRIGEGDQGGVVEAHDRDVPGDLQPALPGRADRAERHHVAGADDRRAVPLDERGGGRLPALQGVEGVLDQLGLHGVRGQAQLVLHRADEALDLALDRDEAIRVIVLTGSERAFAAGADINELSETKPVDFVMKQFFRDWERIRKISKPLIAAVNGYALGGGNELAMCCDMIIASDTAQFGQPEILLGVIPGAGGTQRLTKAVGTKKAMEMILTGKSISAEEALQWRLINRVVPAEDLEKEALSLAKEIAEKPPVAVRLAKQAVLKAQELPLEHGLNLEQNAFFLLFSSEDQSEGMRAFLEKRKPEFRGE